MSKKKKTPPGGEAPPPRAGWPLARPTPPPPPTPPPADPPTQGRPKTSIRFLPANAAIRNSTPPTAGFRYRRRLGDMYKYYRSTPLVRAYGLEKALGTSAHIFQERECIADGLPQAQFSHPASLLLQEGRCQKRHHRDRCRTVGRVALLCGIALRTRRGGLSGKKFHTNRSHTAAASCRPTAHR